MSQATRYLFLGLFLVGSAVAKPSLTGIWVRDAVQSDPSTAIIGPRGKVSHSARLTMDVRHEGRNLQVEVEQDGRETKLKKYILDNRWHGIDRAGLGLGAASYRAKWKGDTLVIQAIAYFRGNYGDMRVQTEQEWVLSPGGKILTVTTRYQDRNSTTSREIFNKR